MGPGEPRAASRKGGPGQSPGKVDCGVATVPAEEDGKPTLIPGKRYERGPLPSSEVICLLRVFKNLFFLPRFATAPDARGRSVCVKPSQGAVDRS